MNRILGIVAEYNPFHHGHYHQLKTAMKETGCNYTVVALSGNFVQRGEPAVFDKWTRAKIALTAGADLVLEIPTWFVLHSAEGFARAGIALLSCCGITHLSFGSETASQPNLLRLANWLELPVTQDRIKTQLQEGITYAAAVQRAAESDPATIGLAPMLTGANDILAIEYMRAVQRFSPGIEIHPVKRIGPVHDSMEAGVYASATRLRRLLAAGKTAEVKGYIPQCSKTAFEQALDNKPIFTQDLSQALFYSLLTMGPEDVSALPSCSEGLENRVKKALAKHRDLEGLIRAIKTKRYPRTRIQRLLMQALLRFHNTTYKGGYSPYLRILACSTRGSELLPELTKLGKAPLIYSARDIKHLDDSAKALLHLDQRAADVYSLAQGAAVQDVYQTPVRQ